MVWCDMLYMPFSIYCRSREATRHLWTREDESELSELFEQYKDDSGEQAGKCWSRT